MTSEQRSVVALEWPDRLPGYDWHPAHHHDRLEPLKLPPPGIVIHSGAVGPGVAEWAWRSDVAHQNKYFAHFAWSSSLERYVQTASLHYRALHAGHYNDWLGIEMPGPWHLDPRPMEQRIAVQALVIQLVDALPSIGKITGHEHINEVKHDPGPGVTADWFADLGLEVYWRWVGESLLR